MSYNDDLKIFYNLLAQSPLGLSDPHLIGKFAKAKSLLHQFDSFNAVQAHKKANTAPVQPLQTPISGQPDQSTTPTPVGSGGLQGAPNTPSVPSSTQGGGSQLNLPQ
jgi:hypothetical protein